MELSYVGNKAGLLDYLMNHHNKLFSVIDLLEETHLSKCCDAIIVNGRCFNCKDNVE